MRKPNGLSVVAMTDPAPTGRAPRRLGPLQGPMPKRIAIAPEDRRAHRKAQRAARRITRLRAR